MVTQTSVRRGPLRARPHPATLAPLAVYLIATLGVLAFGLGASLAHYLPSLHDKLHDIGFGSGVVARFALALADASHHAQPSGQLVLDYLFSGFNLALAGFLIWLRPRDATALLLAVGMIGTAAIFNLQAESVYGALAKTPADTLAYNLHRLIAAGAYVYALLLFPDGQLIPRWKVLPKAILYVPPSASFAFLALRAQGPGGPGNPVSLIMFFGLVTPVTAVIAQGYRFRRSPTPEQRQQSRLLFWALVPALVIGLFVLTQGLRSVFNPQLQGRPLEELPVLVFRIFQPVFALIPIALFVGLVRYRLWNIDRLISRTLVYGALAGFISAAYVGVVVGIGRLVGAQGNNLLLSIAATGLVAAGFQPLKERLQRLADRVVYGRRITPYEVLSEFSERMMEAEAAGDLLPRMAELLAKGATASRAEVWLRIRSQLRASAVWPDGAEPMPSPVSLTGDELPAFPGAARAVAIRHRGELLGALAVFKPSSEALSLPEDKLVSDLAAQAGLVVRNLRLTTELLDRLEELRASRQRLVAAQDEERRRLERNIHDGAQQMLVALKVKIGLAGKRAGEDGPVRGLLGQLEAEADEALQTLRDLARGIYPPLLAAEGLPAALTAHTRKVPLPVEISADGIGRYSQDIEAAVYFCCLEALQNVAKYAGASRARVQITDGKSLTFAVSDDGGGFDPESVRKGSGVQNMTDRVEALGGWLRVESSPGAGCVVTGAIPIV